MNTPQPFWVAKNVVHIFAPAKIRLTIAVPWDTNEEVTECMKNFVRIKTMGVMRYLVSEAIIPDLNQHPVDLMVQVHQR